MQAQVSPQAWQFCWALLCPDKVGYTSTHTHQGFPLGKCCAGHLTGRMFIYRIFKKFAGPICIGFVSWLGCPPTVLRMTQITFMNMQLQDAMVFILLTEFWSAIVRIIVHIYISSANKTSNELQHF
jgi:hypothetical protein